MNAQQLEYVRIQLRAALVDDSGGTKGQLEAFAEHPLADKDLHPRKQLHVVELDNGRGGVRRVKAENSALYVMETRSRRHPMPPIRDMAFCSSTWRRRVLGLNSGHQAWVRYCYGFDLQFSHQVEICEMVWNIYKRRPEMEGLQKRVVKKLLSLVWLAVQDVAAVHKNAKHKEYAGLALANLMSVNGSTWSRVYKSHWTALKRLVADIDILILSKILITLRK